MEPKFTEGDEGGGPCPGCGKHIDLLQNYRSGTLREGLSGTCTCGYEWELHEVSFEAYVMFGAKVSDG